MTKAMSRTWPDPLEPGDTVAVVAPSGPLTPERVDRGVDRLTSWGLSVAPGKHVHDRHQQLGYLAGDDQDRAADFMTAWTDPAVSAIWCARGGYGAHRMVDLLDFCQLRAAGPKHLIGFSDITALHARIGRELGQVTLHAPTATSTQLDDPATGAALDALAFRAPGSGQHLLAGDALIPGVAEGRLIGGNLALITGDLAVEPAPDEPTIAVFEDVGEEAYRLDRMLTQLRRSGWFRDIRGIVLGEFTETGDADRVHAVLKDRLTDLDVPIMRHAPVGHGHRNLALPLGARVRLDAGSGDLRLS